MVWSFQSRVTELLVAHACRNAALRDALVDVDIRYAACPDGLALHGDFDTALDFAFNRSTFL